MRFLAYETPDGVVMGVVEGDLVRPLTAIAEFYADPLTWIGASGGDPVDRSSLALRPFVPTDAKVLCVGLNYPKHIAEMGHTRPDRPNLFARWASTLCCDGDSTPVPPGEDGLDFEAELAVVIGRELSDVSVDDAMSGVLGYTCFDDISARTFQRATSQWALGKNADRSGPIGPVLVTGDELGDPYGGSTHLMGQVA